MNTDKTVHYFDARRLLDKFDPEAEAVAIAEALGVSLSTVKQWRANNRYRLDPYKADRYALRIGLHPCLVWGDDWWQAALQAA